MSNCSRWLILLPEHLLAEKWLLVIQVLVEQGQAPLTADEVHQRWPEQAFNWYNHPEQAQTAGGESLADLRARARHTVSELIWGSLRLGGELWHNGCSREAHPAAMHSDFYTRLVYVRRSRIFGRLAYLLLKLLGVEIPRSVTVGPGFLLEHGGFGTVIHSSTRIGARVKIYPGVTIGRADIYRPAERSAFEGVVIEDDAILCPGCKVLGKAGVLRVGRGTVLGANAVLLESTGEDEIWAGVPARCIGRRDPQEQQLVHGGGAP